MTVTVSVPEELVRFVETKLSEGRYKTSDEVVGEALRLLERVERENADKLRDLREAVQEGIDSGPAEDLDFEALKAEGRRRLATFDK